MFVRYEQVIDLPVRQKSYTEVAVGRYAPGGGYGTFGIGRDGRLLCEARDLAEEIQAVANRCRIEGDALVVRNFGELVKPSTIPHDGVEGGVRL